MDSLISIIIPVYNSEKYLKKCIESVLNQTYKNIEVFLIDDGSTDRSGSICDQYVEKDKRVHVIHKNNEGQGVARNVALDLVRGEYVAFVDSDDYLIETMYEELYQSVVCNNADMSICGVINDHYFCKKECPKKDENMIYNRSELFISYLTEPYVRSILVNKLYRIELWKNIRFPAIRAREDEMVLYHIYGQCQRASYINRSLYVQLIRPGSTEQSPFNTSRLNSVEMSMKLTEYIENNVQELIPYSELLVANAYRSVLRQIASDRYFSRFIDLYNDFLGKLRLELKKHEIHSEINQKLYDELCHIAIDQRNFFRICKKYRRKYALINGIKRILDNTFWVFNCNKMR